ncbi:MAG: hypothetical protein R3D26_20870 [Cyanobacteriota/Melainabacteria group bacterium]
MMQLRRASVVPDKTFNEFARNNGLDTRQTPDGKLEFSLRYKGEKLTIGSVEKTGDGLKEINKVSKEFTELKEVGTGENLRSQIRQTW